MIHSPTPSGGYFFLAGIKCFFKGISAFYAEKTLWKYAYLPMFLMALAYILFLVCAVLSAGFLMHKLEALLPPLPQWLAWCAGLLSAGAAIAAILLSVIISIFTATAVFEIFAGPFFDRLIVSYEKKTRGIDLTELSFKETLLQIYDSLRYSIRSLFILLLLTFSALFIPLAGPVLLVLVSGYQQGFTYMMPSGFLHKQRLKELQTATADQKMAVLSFGLLVYGLFLLPVLPIFLIPGVILGGTELFHLSAPAEKDLIQ